MARRDAMYYILARGRPGDSWTEDDFYASGAETVRRALALARPEGHGTAVEIGCGLGRNLFALAGQFGRAVGFDISDEMVAGAMAAERRPENAIARRTNGSTLPEIEGASVDFLLSAIVLQHIPRWEDVAGYLGEIGRVLGPDGRAAVQFDSRPVTIARRAYMALPDAVLPSVHRRGMRRHPRPAALIRETIRASGLTIQRETGAGSASHWFVLAPN